VQQTPRLNPPGAAIAGYRCLSSPWMFLQPCQIADQRCVSSWTPRLVSLRHNRLLLRGWLLGGALGLGGAKSPPLHYQGTQTTSSSTSTLVVSPTHVVEEMAKISTIKLACRAMRLGRSVRPTIVPLVGVDLTRFGRGNCRPALQPYRR